MSPRQSLNRQKVLEKATELIISNGWDELNLHVLAKALSIQPPSLYNHIQGMADLKYGISLAARRALNDKISAATVGKSGAKACLALARAYLDFSRMNPGLLYAITIAPDKNDPEAMQIDEEILTIGRAIMAEFALDDRESIHALRALRCASHGFAVLEQEQGFGLDVDPDISFEWMIRKLVEGFGKRA